MEPKDRDLKLYGIIIGIFVTVLVLVPPTASKFIAIGPFNLSGATLIFPIAFIFNDVLTEVYGYTRSRRIIWTGMACQLLAAFSFWLVGVWPAAPFWNNQEAYNVILGSTLRITIASFIAYFCGEFANSIVMSKMKFRANGARGLKQGWRFVLSTVVGEAVDSIVFMTVGFLGVIPTPDLIKTIATIYVFKVLYEIVALPVSTRISNWIKKIEGVDKIDHPQQTNYNPFAVFSVQEEKGLHQPPR